MGEKANAPLFLHERERERERDLGRGGRGEREGVREKVEDSG